MLTPEALARIDTHEKAESEIYSAGQVLDPGDIYTVLSVIADYMDAASMTEFIEHDRIVRDILEATQSNYEEAYEAVSQMAQIDDHQSTLDD